MRHLTITILLFALFSQNTMAQSRPIYLEAHKDIAIQEMNRSGIPASIILAQAIVESAWGKATLAQAANNHFGIKCKSEWTGDSYLLQDDDYDSNGILIESCFRAYPDVLSSFRDHTDFLLSGKRYRELFSLSAGDYVGWAHGLKACGYATDPAYAEKLIKKVEEYRLYEFDQLEVVMEAPSFEIPYGSTASQAPAISNEAAAQSLIIAADFGLIEVEAVSTTEPAIVQEEEIMEMPTYEIPSAVKLN